VGGGARNSRGGGEPAAFLEKDPTRFSTDAGLSSSSSDGGGGGPAAAAGVSAAAVPGCLQANTIPAAAAETVSAASAGETGSAPCSAAARAFTCKNKQDQAPAGQPRT
jgi:hypothetical protein